MKTHASKQAFTLVELMVAVAIVGILTGIADILLTRTESLTR
jgi:prepilin-type N-terminal cleavage/methylation domain-containing protein